MRKLLLATHLLAALFRVASWRVTGKRKTGQEGRALRRYLIFYARSIGSPVWECAEIFCLNRKQIGIEESAYLEILADNDGLAKNADHITDMLDAALRINRAQFLTTSLAAIQADAAAKKALRTIRAAADTLAVPSTPASVSWIEAERAAKRADLDAYVRDRLAQQQADKYARAVAILEAVIARGEIKGANREARDDAGRARRALVEIKASLAPAPL